MFLVVFPWVFSGIDIKESVLAGISPAMEIGEGHGVRVIPAGARGARSELVAVAPMRRNHGRALFFRAVHFGRNELPMPMDEFGHVSIVDDVDGYRFALAHADQRARRGSVITDGAEGPVRGEFHQDWRDFQREIRGRLWRAGVPILRRALHEGHLRRLLCRQQSAKTQTTGERAPYLDEVASVHFSSLPRTRIRVLAPDPSA